MESKIRIKVGTIEVEFEGSEEYLRDQLPSLIELLVSMSPEEQQFAEEEEEEEVLPETTDSSKKTLQLTTNTIAAKLGVKSGPDLILAVCAHLSLVKGADTFHRKNILAEMKLASNYYKKTHGKNLSQSLKSLIRDGKLIESAQDVYAIEAETKKWLEEQLRGL